MKENKLFINVLMLAVLVAVLLGCIPHKRYEVSTFFFTGVPPTENDKAKLVVEDEKVVREALVKKNLASKPKLFSHAPYIQRQCDQCHRKMMPSSSKKRGVVPGSEVVPPKEVCIGCHPNKSPSWAFTEGLWLHAPVSQNNCNLCHSPHQSTIPSRLIEKISKVCIQCHSEGYRMNTPVHRNATECLSCHNPHLGNDSLLLKKDYDEGRSRHMAIISHKN